MEQKEIELQLEKLRSFLSGIPGREGPGHGVAFGNRPNYSDNIHAYQEITSKSVEGYRQYLTEMVMKALNRKPEGVLNICSIGCGTGEVDFVILSKVKDVCPRATINFVGIDVDAILCSEAKEKLSKLPYETTIMNQDFMQIDATTLPKFDLILMAHVHYYFTDKKSLFAKVADMIEPMTGSIEIVLTDESMPMWWLSGMFLTGNPRRADIKDILTKDLGLKCVVCSIPGEADFSRCIAEGFDTEFGKNLLDFLCKVKLSDYPPEVTEQCIAYLKTCMNEEYKTKLYCKGITVTRQS